MFTCILNFVLPRNEEWKRKRHCEYMSFLSFKASSLASFRKLPTLHLTKRLNKSKSKCKTEHAHLKIQFKPIQINKISLILADNSVQIYHVSLIKINLNYPD